MRATGVHGWIAALLAVVALVASTRPLEAQGEPAEASDTPCAAPPAEPFEVGSLVWDASLPFLAGFIRAQEETASCLGIALDLQDGLGHFDTQVEVIERFIDEGKDLIIVTTIETDGIVPVIGSANQAGIPVISTFVPIGEGAEVVTFVGYDDYSIGRLQGEMLVDAIGEEARVGLLHEGAGSWAVRIEQGLTDYLAEYQGIDLIEAESASGDESRLRAVIEGWLSTYPAGELDAILAQGPELLAAALSAGEQGRDDVRFFIGSHDERVDAAVDEGLIAGSVLSEPGALGAAAVRDAWSWLSGARDDVERPEHFVAPVIVTHSNVDEYPLWPLRSMPEPTAAPTPESTAAPTPEPAPTRPPMSRAEFERKARRMCLRSRPSGLYRTRAGPIVARGARGMDVAHLVLVEYRDLSGARRRRPRLRQGFVYDLDATAPFRWGSPGDVDALACLALRATRRETWQATATGTLYTVDAADAIIWVVDAGNGRRIGRTWLRRPPKPGSGRNHILFGDGGPGVRPPPAERISTDVERFLGR